MPHAAIHETAQPSSRHWARTATNDCVYELEVCVGCNNRATANCGNPTPLTTYKY